MKMKMMGAVGVGVAAAVGLTVAAPAEADDQSFIQYLDDLGFGIQIGPLIGPNTPEAENGIIPNPEKALADGHMLCDEMRAGATFEDEQAKYGHLPNFRPIMEAAQRELCPDTM